LSDQAISREKKCQRESAKSANEDAKKKNKKIAYLERCEAFFRVRLRALRVIAFVLVFFSYRSIAQGY
jgi:hypothetical protein